MSDLFQTDLKKCIDIIFAQADKEILLGFLDEIHPDQCSMKSMSPWKVLESQAVQLVVYFCRKDKLYRNTVSFGAEIAARSRNGVATPIIPGPSCVKREGKTTYKRTF